MRSFDGSNDKLKAASISRLTDQKYQILHYNIQGLSGKNCELEVLLRSGNYTVVCLNEHWLSEEQMSAFCVDGYVNVSSFCRSMHRDGGVAIFATNKSKSLEPLHFDPVEYSCEMDFEVAGSVVDGVQILTIYRSPTGNFDLYLSKLDSVLGRLSYAKNVVITGDFNVHFENNTRQSQLLCSLFGSYGLYRTTTQATRLNACLDNIFTNIPKCFFLQR